MCAAVAESAVLKALGGPVASTAHYDNGEELELPSGRRDVSHEFGCVYDGAGGVRAQVWVFARPVGPGEAAALVRAARRGGDCDVPDPVGFGEPGRTSVCAVPGNGDRVRARLEGLFTDTWVGCEVSAPRDDAHTGNRLAQRAVSFCTAAVAAAAAKG
jgi:hypothetical protein